MVVCTDLSSEQDQNRAIAQFSKEEKKMLHEIKQDLTTLTGQEKLIVQQTNLVHVKGEAGKGLAEQLHHRWPHCHPYDRKGVQPSMGSIQIIASQHNSPTICCLNAQRNVGRQQIKDDYEERLVAFQNGLDRLRSALKKDGALHNVVKMVYFPNKIGCGYGHGNWQKYHALVLAFADAISPIPSYLCHLP